MTTFLMHIVDMCLLLLAFITENSSLEPLLECLFTQIHVDWSWRAPGFRPESNKEPADNPSLLSPALFSTEHQKNTLAIQ